MTLASRPSPFPQWWPDWARPRRPVNTGEWVAAAVVTFFSLLLAWRALIYIADLWYLTPLPIAAGAAAWKIRHTAREREERARRSRMAALSLTAGQLDALSPLEFELATRDLMIRDGIRARHVGQRGDQAADVIGRCQTTGQTWVAQCKHTTVGARVGAQVMYQVSGTATPIHGADLAVVITNGGFTRDAITNANLLGIHLVDREILIRWASQGVTLHQALGLKQQPNP